MPEHLLSPLRFTEHEIDALIRGLCLVRRAADADDDLGEAADAALARIAAILPPAPADTPRDEAPDARHKATVRTAIRTERKLLLRYSDKKGVASERVIWPIALDDLYGGDVLAAWCERRADFRHFRLDRIVALTPLTEPLPRRHRILRAEWSLSTDEDEW